MSIDILEICLTAYERAEVSCFQDSGKTELQFYADFNAFAGYDLSYKPAKLNLRYEISDRIIQAGKKQGLQDVCGALTIVGKETLDKAKSNGTVRSPIEVTLCLSADDFFRVLPITEALHYGQFLDIDLTCHCHIPGKSTFQTPEIDDLDLNQDHELFLIRYEIRTMSKEVSKKISEDHFVTTRTRRSEKD